MILGFIGSLITDALGGQVAKQILGVVVGETLTNIIKGKLEESGVFDLDTHGVIEKYAEDLVQKAKEGKIYPATGRDVEIDTAIAHLSLGNNPCIIGEAGTGKTTIVEGLAYRIAQGDVPEDVKDWQILKVDLVKLIAGSGYSSSNGMKGLVRLRAVFEYAKSHPNVVLFIDEVHQFSGYADLCKTYMDRGEIKLIGATTNREFAYISKDPALERRFKKVYISQPSKQASREMAKNRAAYYEKKYGVKISDQILEVNDSLVNRYMPCKPSPDKEIKNLELACSLAVKDAAKGAAKGTAKDAAKDAAKGTAKDAAKDAAKGTVVEVTQDHILKAIEMMTGVPVTTPDVGELFKLLTMPARFNEDLIGHGDLVNIVYRRLRNARYGLNNPERLRGAFLLAGPSGVGKSKFAEMIAKEVGKFDILEASQYKKNLRLSIVEEVKNNPYCALVFEGIDEASPEVVSTLLSIIDRGYDYDVNNQKVDFRNAVIILTANTGSEAKTKEEIKSVLYKKLGGAAVNKVDDILAFEQLSEADAIKVTEKCLNKTAENIKGLYGVNISFDENLVRQLSKMCFDLNKGVRGVKMYAERDMFDFLIDNVAGQTFKPGNNVLIKEVNGNLAIEVVEAKAQETTEVDLDKIEEDGEVELYKTEEDKEVELDKTEEVK